MKKTRGVKIRPESPTLSYIEPSRIEEIKKSAYLAMKNRGGTDYNRTIDIANIALSKFERGIFVGFALSCNGGDK